MNYKRICTVLGIILILSCTIVWINNTKENIVHRKQIEDKLNFSDEEKKALNYRKLVEDIKCVEDGEGLKYAKQESTETQNNGGGVKLVMYSKEYKGDGYIVRLPSVTDVTIYEFVRNDDCVYSVVLDGLSNSEEANKFISKSTSNIIVYALIIIMAIFEMIFGVLYRKQNRAMNSIEDEKKV